VYLDRHEREAAVEDVCDGCGGRHGDEEVGAERLPRPRILGLPAAASHGSLVRSPTTKEKCT
jgi:hypothetical protein